MTKTQLEVNEKLRIIKIHNKGYTQKEISWMYDISINTVKSITKKDKENRAQERKKGTGSKLKYDETLIKDILIIIIKENRGLTLLEIKCKLETIHNIKYSKSNISKILKKMDYTKKMANLKIPLTNDHLNDRQYWCFFYNNFDAWESVIWSDETKICNDHEKQKIWICKDENVIRHKYRYPLKINVWGAMIKNKGLIFEIFDKTLNSDAYVEILNKHLLPLYKNSNNTCIFQQDNAPCHTSQKTINFFSENKIEVMYWPPCSPDLNPIENVWYLIKLEIRKKYYKNKVEMIEEVTKILNNFSIVTVNKLVDSMNNRIEMLFNKNFDIIDY